jgi:hypothetical protein
VAGNGTPRTATYQVSAPGGAWDGPDDGTYAVSLVAGQVRDVAGNPAAAAGPVGSFQAALAAAVQSIRVNDGDAQRTTVTGLTVTFDRAVGLDAGAVVLAGRNGAGAGVTAAAANPSGDGRTYVLSFGGGGTTGGALPTGVYDLTVRAAGVHPAGTPAGGAGMAADVTFTFHRLFGDINGDRAVNAGDISQIIAHGFYNSGAGGRRPADGDLNGDGFVNAGDISALIAGGTYNTALAG